MAVALPVLSRGQSSNVQQLGIGDKVPDLTFSNLVNYTSPVAKLSAFSGKLVILDFWATWCGTCLKKIPLLDSAQKKFGNRLQILLVSNEGGNPRDEDKVKAFLEKRQVAGRGSFSLPATTVQNPLLLQLFPHTFIPHYVWISPQGRVFAITSFREMTLANIEAMLNGCAVAMPVKNDTRLHHPN